MMISPASPARRGRLLTVSVPSCVSVVSMRYACMGVPSTNECTHIIPSGAATEKDEKNKSPRYPKHVDSAFASFFLVSFESSQDGLSHLTLALPCRRKPQRGTRLGRPPARWSRDSFSAGPPPNRAEPLPCYTALQWARSTVLGRRVSPPLPRLSYSTCGPSPCC